MRTILALAGTAAIVFLIAAQFAGPDEDNGRIDPAQTIEAQTKMPLNVAAILGRACQDCHSERTEWRWYGHIAPMAWLQMADVYAGRQHMNFSTWGQYSTAQQDRRLLGMCVLARRRSMPLWYYRFVHYSQATLSDSDLNTLCGWTEAERARLKQSGQ